MFYCSPDLEPAPAEEVGRLAGGDANLGMGGQEVLSVTVGNVTFTAPALIVHIKAVAVLEYGRRPDGALVPLATGSAGKERLAVVDLCPVQHVVGVGHVETLREVWIVGAGLVCYEPFVAALHTEYLSAVYGLPVTVVGSAAFLINLHLSGIVAGIGIGENIDSAGDVHIILSFPTHYVGYAAVLLPRTVGL